MNPSWRFASVVRSPHPGTPQEETDARFAAGYDDACGEIYDTNALSFTDQFGKRAVYHVRCGARIGRAQRCMRRAGHTPDQCDPRWEFP